VRNPFRTTDAYSFSHTRHDHVDLSITLGNRSRFSMLARFIDQISL
jgi:hypothetical protein